MSDPNHASALVPAVVFLSAAVCAVLLSKRLKLGAVIGYLLAGVVIGPQVLKLITDDEQALIQSAAQSRKELAALFEADSKMVPEQNI